MTCNHNIRQHHIAGIVALTLLGVAGHAAAPTEAAPPTGWSGALGIGAVSQATYPASPNQREFGVPMVQLSYTTARVAGAW